MHSLGQADAQEPVGEAPELPFGGSAIDRDTSRHPARGRPRQGPTGRGPRVNLGGDAQRGPFDGEMQARGGDAIGRAIGGARQALLQLFEQLGPGNQAVRRRCLLVRLGLRGDCNGKNDEDREEHPDAADRTEAVAERGNHQGGESEGQPRRETHAKEGESRTRRMRWSAATGPDQDSEYDVQDQLGTPAPVCTTLCGSCS